DNVAHRLGFAPQHRITTPDAMMSAAIWRFQHKSSYELTGRANENMDLISMPVRGHDHHHTYFANGRQKWSRMHAAFHMNIVAAGEQPRGVFTSEQPFTYLHIYMSHTVVERLAVESGAIDRGQTVVLLDPMCSRDPFVEAICRQILREMTNRDGCSRMMFESLGQQLAVRLIRRHSTLSGSAVFAGTRGRGYRDWRLRRAIEYLEAHLSDDISLTELAKVVGLSTPRLTALFREGTGEPPYRWLMNRRFARALELLGNPSLTISEIAYQCGFASSQHLATVTRRQLAITPTDYRRQLLG
ncbi:MAG TPA: AraC family transcriptional regulator, partial [Propionibacteriaceae bacterium]|nr:AraC family transcriptional regulator [Propionibacteriaceae bacterium]